MARKPAPERTTGAAGKTAGGAAARGGARNAGGRAGLAQGARSGGRRRRPTPEQSLAASRELLQARRQQARQVPPWRRLEQGGTAVPQAGEAGGAATPAEGATVQALHEAETRLPAQHGSTGTHDRRNQRKRDRRG
ncbi:MAG: hypothetical protein C0P65_002575 [Lysobacteraceae bacterium]